MKDQLLPLIITDTFKNFQIITKYKNLRVLYLHGNAIDKIQDIKKLSSLPQLRNLTLHGNPIEQAKGYRQVYFTKVIF